ncbi:hypothetical protein IQ31_04583 [Sphingobacterium siyangense]|uniref:Uncharacterized protein n=1 Tax=Sphingobacterium siyangense TaxID=459529 RepID=A0A562M8C5_9SPHI|nr:hypothetical protein IQ31_04583 [Sphingobacterium siyangense]
MRSTFLIYGHSFMKSSQNTIVENLFLMHSFRSLINSLSKVLNMI